MASHTRSLSDALELTPEVESFISGHEKPVEVNASKAEHEEQAGNKDSVSEGLTKKANGSEQSNEKKISEDNSVSIFEARVAVTTRFRQATAETLRRVSLERKLMGKRPWSQQEIIEEAVQAWMRKEKADKTR